MIKFHRAGFDFLNTNWGELFPFLLEFSDADLALAAKLKPTLLTGDELKFLKVVQVYKNDPKLNKAINAFMTLKRSGAWVEDKCEFFMALSSLEEKDMGQLVELVISEHKKDRTFITVIRGNYFNLFKLV